MTRAAIKHAEEQLRSAMLAADVGALDGLLHESLVFVGPEGDVIGKNDDLELYRSGAMRVARHEVKSLAIELAGSDVGVATALVDLDCTLRGEPFEGTVRQLRTWRRGDDGAWRVIAGAAVRASG